MTKLSFQNILNPQRSKCWMLCFHHVGGSHLDYLFLRKLKNVEIWVLELPGRDFQNTPNLDPKSAVKWLGKIANFVKSLSKEGDRSGAFFGMSFGAQMAFQAGRVLDHSSLNKAVDQIFVASSLAPVQFAAHDVSHYLSADDSWLGQEFGLITKEEARKGIDKFKKKMIDRIRYDYGIYQLWQSLPFEMINIPITGFFAQSDPLIESNTSELWAQSTYLDFSHHWLEGGHFFTPPSRKDLVSIISKKLN